MLNQDASRVYIVEELPNPIPTPITLSVLLIVAFYGRTNGLHAICSAPREPLTVCVSGSDWKFIFSMDD